MLDRQGQEARYFGHLRLVGAPQGHKLVILIPIGYLAESPEKSKQPLSDVPHWDIYS